MLKALINEFSNYRVGRPCNDQLVTFKYKLKKASLMGCLNYITCRAQFCGYMLSLFMLNCKLPVNHTTFILH